MVVEIDPKKCKMCSTFSGPACVDKCPDYALSLREKTIVVTEFLCEDCNECSMVCPDKAIKIKKVTF
jgi:MinD superfamily P-loop ATPase